MKPILLNSIRFTTALPENSKATSAPVRCGAVRSFCIKTKSVSKTKCIFKTIDHHKKEAFQAHFMNAHAWELVKLCMFLCGVRRNGSRVLEIQVVPEASCSSREEPPSSNVGFIRLSHGGTHIRRQHSDECPCPVQGNHRFVPVQQSFGGTNCIVWSTSQKAKAMIHPIKSLLNKF